MQRLRSVAFHDSTLFAVAGPQLLTADLGALSSDGEQVCPAVTLDDTLYFHGESIARLLTEFDLPFPNAVLPDRPRSYPGARRLYRFGIHTGMDLYANDAGGLGFGSPVSAIADGTVLRVDHDYAPIRPAAFDAALAQTEAQHRTDDELFELFMGRQVQLDHGRRIASYYGHLNSTAPALSVGGLVLQGAAIGTVGVTGTSGGAYGHTDGAHLHYEIWINDRYLGQGLTLFETMRLWQAIFE
jgi:murein DD-endopeptidase MepM/ murein hydrolase activator NlpD